MAFLEELRKDKLADMRLDHSLVQDQQFPCLLEQTSITSLSFRVIFILRVPSISLAFRCLGNRMDRNVASTRQSNQSLSHAQRLLTAWLITNTLWLMIYSLVYLITVLNSSLLNMLFILPFVQYSPLLRKGSFMFCLD